MKSYLQILTKNKHLKQCIVNWINIRQQILKTSHIYTYQEIQIINRGNSQADNQVQYMKRLLVKVEKALRGS